MTLVPQDEIEKIRCRLTRCTLAELKKLEADARPGTVEYRALQELNRRVEEEVRKLNVRQRYRLKVWAGDELPPVPTGKTRFTKTIGELLDRDRWRAAPKGGSSVTDFTKWIHTLYHSPIVSDAAMEEGRMVERMLAKRNAMVSHPDWELVFRDPLNRTSAQCAKPIPALSINGRAMMGVPDLVYRHRPTGKLVIVEIKASDKKVPIGGWPDLRAQLWCYAQISDPAWQSATSIRLVAEVWCKDDDGELHLRRSEGGLMAWTKGHPELEESSALFDVYKERLEARWHCRPAPNAGR